MLDGALKAERGETLDLAGVDAPAIDSVPARVVTVWPAPSRLSRLRTMAPGTTVSLIVHAVLTVFGIMLWRAMVHDLTAPEPISVELVNSVPGGGTSGSPGANKTDQAKSETKSDAKSETKNPAPVSKPGTPAAKPSVLDQALPMPSANDPLVKTEKTAVTPSASKTVGTGAPPPQGSGSGNGQGSGSGMGNGQGNGTGSGNGPGAGAPSPTLAQPAPTPPQPNSTAGSKTTSQPTTLPVPQPAPKTPSQAAEQATDRPAPALVAPPPDPHRAQTQNQKMQVANTSTAQKPSAVPPPPKSARRVPEILSAAESSETVPQAALPPPDAKADASDASAAPAAETDPNAALAAALPMSPYGFASNFRSAMPGGGMSGGNEYKGAVFGAFSRGPEASRIMEDAQRRQLSGVVVVALTVGDTGNIDGLEVVQSSGTKAVDDMAVELVRSSAPFPAPPPGAPRTFTPAIVIGNP